MVFAIFLALFDHVDDIEDIGFIGNSAEGALVHARPAGNAGIVINGCRLIFVHGDRLDFTGVFTGALAIHNGGIGANPRAGTAIHAFCFINVRHMVMEADGALGTDVLTAACQTPSAGVGDLIAAHGALITGNINDLNDIGVLLIAAHCHAHPFAEDRTLLVDAAINGLGIAGRQLPRDRQHIIQQSIVPRLPRHLPQHLVFDILYLGIKLSHGFSPLLYQKYMTLTRLPISCSSFESSSTSFILILKLMGRLGS